MKKREIRLVFVAIIVAFAAMFVDQAISTDSIGYGMEKPTGIEQGVFAIFGLMNKGSVLMNTDYDLDSDSSIQKYVSVRKPYDDPNYTPADLVEVDTSYVIAKTAKPLLRPEASRAFTAMAQDFYIEYNKKFVLVSAYRSYQDQKRLLGA